VGVILLMEKFIRQISMIHVYVPMLIPAFGTISRDIITEDIDEAGIQRNTIGEWAIRIWHA
jgi:hypothetical protein